MDRCFNARHRSSSSVSAPKTLTIAPPKCVQRLITAREKQRWFSVQDFCVGLADPSVHKLASSGAKLWLSVVIAAVNFAGAENWPFLTARNILCSSKLSERSWRSWRWPSGYGVSLTVANACWTVTSGDEPFSPTPGTLQHRSFDEAITYIDQRMRAYEHTLAYVDAVHCSATALIPLQTH